jgi:hypothetical protein
MLPDLKVRCPATGFTRACREILAECECPKFVSIKGTDPQTGAIVDRHGCVDSFLPLLLIENAQVSRQIGAAIESFRNEVVKANDSAMEERQRLFSAARQQLLG